MLRRLGTLILALIMASCATPAAGFETVRADADFDVTGVPESDVRAIVAADTEFAVDLLRLVSGGDNVFFSPFSITTALGMTEAGARGATREEMAGVLHESLSDASTHPARGALLARVNEEEAVPPGGESLVLRAVDALWLQAGYPVLPSYLDMLAVSYDAPARLVDFIGDTEAARDAINRWVADQTEERIEEMIPQGSVTDLTRLVLTNAVYFLGSWVEPFDPDATETDPFTLRGGSDVDVSYMHAAGEYVHVEGDGFQGVRLPYWGGASMMLLLPEGSPEGLLADLDAAALATVTTRPRTFSDLAVPRFEFSSDLDLVPLLRRLGMTTAFEPPSGDSGADFTGMTENRELFVSGVLHKSFISVDEAGTEAAAATAVVVGTTSAPVDEAIALRFDRPFVFFVQHDGTGSILFAGVVEDPRG